MSIDTETILTPDYELIGKARALAVRLRDRAAEADRNRMLHLETVQELHETGLLTMGIPREFGGAESSLITQHQVYEALAKACASTSWCVGNHTGACRKMHEVMGDAATPYLRAVVDEGAVIAQGVVATGDTRPADGGFVSSGRWPFMSFSKYARWAVLSTTVAGPSPMWEPSNDEPEPPTSHNRQLIVRMDEPGITLADNWHTLSLRASMSNDMLVDEVFIPEECAPAAPSQGLGSLDTPPALRVPPTTSFSPPCTVLGVAQAALDNTVEFASKRSMSIGGQTRGHMPGNQFAIADSAMLIESARAFLLQEARAITVKAYNGIPFDRNDTIRIRMASQVARENSQRAVERLWGVRGSHGLYESEGFERYYRDVRVGTLPAPSAPDLVREQVGKHLLGIPANTSPRWV